MLISSINLCALLAKYILNENSGIFLTKIKTVVCMCDRAEFAWRRGLTLELINENIHEVYS